MNSKKPSRAEQGHISETLAATFLERRGFQILARNVHAGGVELDLVARLPVGADAVETIVFVEVRSRSSVDQGQPSETVGRRKQARLCRGATAWLVERDLWEKTAVRFDVIGVVWAANGPTVQWLAGAFEAN